MPLCSKRSSRARRRVVVKANSGLRPRSLPTSLFSTSSRLRQSERPVRLETLLLASVESAPLPLVQSRTLLLLPRSESRQRPFRPSNCLVSIAVARSPVHPTCLSLAPQLEHGARVDIETRQAKRFAPRGYKLASIALCSLAPPRQVPSTRPLTPQRARGCGGSAHRGWRSSRRTAAGAAGLVNTRPVEAKHLSRETHQEELAEVGSARVALGRALDLDDVPVLTVDGVEHLLVRDDDARDLVGGYRRQARRRRRRKRGNHCRTERLRRRRGSRGGRRSRRGCPHALLVLCVRLAVQAPLLPQRARARLPPLRTDVAELVAAAAVAACAFATMRTGCDRVKVGRGAECE